MRFSSTVNDYQSEPAFPFPYALTICPDNTSIIFRGKAVTKSCKEETFYNKYYICMLEHVLTAPMNVSCCFKSNQRLQSECESTDHASLHPKVVTQKYSPIFANGLSTTPRRSSYCIKAGLYDQFE